MPPADAGLITSSDLVGEPFFHRFSSGDSDFPNWGNGSWLYGDTSTANANLPELPLTSASMGLIKNLFPAWLQKSKQPMPPTT
jgi:hypothetical protein